MALFHGFSSHESSGSKRLVAFRFAQPFRFGSALLAVRIFAIPIPREEARGRVFAQLVVFILTTMISMSRSLAATTYEGLIFALRVFAPEEQDWPRAECNYVYLYLSLSLSLYIYIYIERER